MTAKVAGPRGSEEETKAIVLTKLRAIRINCDSGDLLFQLLSQKNKSTNYKINGGHDHVMVSVKRLSLGYKR